MKKYFSLIAAVLLSVGFVACGSDDPEPAPIVQPDDTEENALNVSLTMGSMAELMSDARYETSYPASSCMGIVIAAPDKDVKTLELAFVETASVDLTLSASKLASTVKMETIQANKLTTDGKLTLVQYDLSPATSYTCILRATNATGAQTCLVQSKSTGR